MSQAGAITTILASAVIVLTGLYATVRSTLRFRDSMRDNTRAVKDNTAKLELLSQVPERLDRLEGRVTALETRRGRTAPVGR